MANEKNLTPFTSEQSREEAVKNGRKGGQASGAAKRRKKAMRQAAAMLLNTPLSANTQTKLMATIKELLGIFGYSEESATYQDALLAGIMLEAMKGDVRAAEFIRDTAGESPALDIRRQELKLRKDELKFKREQQAGAGASNTENNLLSAIMGAEEVDTDDLPEVE
jgi:hypothetical protein